MPVKRWDLVKYLEENRFTLLREGPRHSIDSKGERINPDTARLAVSPSTNCVSKQD
jgi:hypothetical protein